MKFSIPVLTTARRLVFSVPAAGAAIFDPHADRAPTATLSGLVLFPAAGSDVGATRGRSTALPKRVMLLATGPDGCSILGLTRAQPEHVLDRAAGLELSTQVLTVALCLCWFRPWGRIFPFWR